MVMKALREGAKGGFFKYILVGILLMAGGGLVFMDIGGFFRGGVASGDVAKVGKQTISIQNFDRTVRNALSRLGIPPAQAYQAGYINELLGGEIRAGLMLQEASNTGLRIGTDTVAANISRLIQPMVQPGQNPKDVLEQLLRAQGISEQQLVNSIRREMSVNLLGNAVQSGFLAVSDAQVRDLARIENEKRDIEYILFKDKDFKGVEAPTDEKLQDFYEATKERFAVPEQRKSQLLIINTAALKKSIEISDEEIKDVYERNISAYSAPEKRVIEQVILSDAEQAEKVAASARSGKNLKTALQETVNNTTDYFPAKPAEKPELLADLQEPVFSAAAGDILGPLESALGTHVIVVKAIEQAHTIPLEKASKDIRAELMETHLLDAQYDLAGTLDDYLASGEPLETIKNELNIEVQDIPMSDSFGLKSNRKPAFEAFGEDAPMLAQTLFELAEGEASPVTDLADGRMAALLVTEIQDKSYPDFETVKDTLSKQWMSDMRRAGNASHVREIVAEAQENGTSLKDLARAQGLPLQKSNGLMRTSSEVKAPLTPRAIAALFEVSPGTPVVHAAEGGQIVAVVQKSTIPKKPSEEALKAARNKIFQSQQNEAYALYMQDLQDQYGVKINDALLESVYGASQDTQ